MRPTSVILCVLATLSLAACTSDLTEIVIVVDTDYAIDAQLDHVTLTVDGLGEPRVVAVALKDHPMPITLGVVHDGGALGPLTIAATGRLGDDVRVSAKRTEIYFKRGRTMMLRLDLVRACDRQCLTGTQTCRFGECGSSVLGEDDLVPWSRPGRLDAGIDDHDASVLDGGGGSGGSAGSGGNAGNDPDASIDADVEADAMTDAAATDANAVDAAPEDAATDAAMPTGVDCSASACPADGPRGAVSFGFSPSNFDPEDISTQPSQLPTVVIDCGEVVYDTKAKAATSWCPGQPLPVPVEIDNPVAPKPMALAFRYLHITPGSTLRLVGEQPAVLVVFGDAWIDGAIDASARGAVPGAGGNMLCGAAEMGSDGASATMGLNGGRGGGGGGFGTSGGTGGIASTSGTATPAGAVSAEIDLTPLRGGCAGGRGGSGFANSVRASGGAGGGAVQLAVAGALHVRGRISAAGGGGRKASPPNTGSSDGSNGGGGGGSGGAILIEAAVLSFAAEAWLAANGGGGGAGLAASVSVDSSKPGDEGHGDDVPAAGGQGGSITPGLIPAGGSGGAGAAGPISASNGANAPSGLAGRGGGGGGGGGAGRIIVNRAAACALPASFSPAPSISALSGACP